MKRFTSHSVMVWPAASVGRDLLERFGANAIDAAAGLQVHLQLLGGPARFEELDQVGRGGDLDARAANQLERAAIHQRHIGDGAVRRILHRDLAAAGQQPVQSVYLRAPTGIFADIAGQSGENAGLDGVNQASRFAVGGNEVIPATRGDAVSDSASECGRREDRAGDDRKNSQPSKCSSRSAA